MPGQQLVINYIPVSGFFFCSVATGKHKICCKYLILFYPAHDAEKEVLAWDMNLLCRALSRIKKSYKNIIIYSYPIV